MSVVIARAGNTFESVLEILVYPSSLVILRLSVFNILTECVMQYTLSISCNKAYSQHNMFEKYHPKYFHLKNTKRFF